MITMKQFFSLVRKEFYHILRDRRTMFILLGMPIAQIILFGFALTNEVKNARIAIFDQSKDIATNALTSQISSSRYFDVEDNLHSYKEIEETFRKGSIKLAIVFPENFLLSLFPELLLHENKNIKPAIAAATIVIFKIFSKS